MPCKPPLFEGVQRDSCGNLSGATGPAAVLCIATLRKPSEHTGKG